MKELNLNLDGKKLKNVVGRLNILLANYTIYYQNLRNFHWNITGINFFVLHEQFETLYNEARENIDLIAERIRTLKSMPETRMSKYLEMGTIREDHGMKSDMAMVSKLIEDHNALILNLRDTIEMAQSASDEGTVDVVSSILASLEKNSWMLDSWMNRQTSTKAQSRVEVEGLV